jgi:mono/diheme cytochrome c family protein
MNALILAAAFLAQNASSADTFEKLVRPVFAQNCQGCHNPKAKRAGLDLTTGEGFYKGADSGPLVDLAKPAESRLLKVISYHERLKMPPTGKLKDAEIAAITDWVNAGAVWPGVDAKLITESRNAAGKRFTDGQRRFWSFQPRKAARPPTIESPWVKSPIDAFILAKLTEKGLTPAPPAARLTLLRRATFDLTGLPPTEQEIADFLSDESPNAFEKVIDRLLASPRYGERWGRHWLDVARYADSTGADEDHRYPDAWRYRDYVIDAFNRDVPFNRFVIEQIAGDLLPPEGEDAKIGVNRRGIIATGFLAIGPRLIAEQDKKKMFYDFVDEQVATTTRTFLGLTVDCARCHDHKFDPILQKDYYSLASIFASTKSFAKLEGTVSQMYRPPLVPAAEYQAWDRAQQRIQAKKTEIELLDSEQSSLRMEKLAGNLAAYMLAAKAAGPETGLDRDILARWKKYLAPGGDVRPYLERWEKAKGTELASVAASYAAEFSASGKEYREAVVKWKQAVATANEQGLPGPERPKFDNTYHRFFEDVYLRKEGPFAPPENFASTFAPAIRAQREKLEQELAALRKASPPQPDLAIGVSEGEPVEQHLFVRGDAHAEGEVVPKQFPVILAGDQQTPIVAGSGRNELAAWLTEPSHPLVPRVIVNRIWQWHFGEGIVRTPSNYGLLGEKPTHPELLDWLAQDFIDNGWSIKKLHKTIMLSNTYLQSSQITKEKSEKDPSNRLYSRFDRRRLDVEEIRDAMLAIDGSIDLTMGGSLQDGTGTDGENSSKRMSIDPATSKRRTVYIPLRRSNLPTLLNLFDFGDATTTMEARARTNVAPQALFVMNSPFVNARAGTIAEQTRQAPVEQAIREAFLRILSRPARDEEVSMLAQYAASFQADSEFAKRRSVYRILFGSNEFLYVD